jgi:hypothetical protein
MSDWLFSVGISAACCLFFVGPVVDWIMDMHLSKRGQRHVTEDRPKDDPWL